MANVGYSEAIMTPGEWHEAKGTDKLRAGAYIEPGLYAGISSMIGHRYHARGDEGRKLYFAEVQYDKFDFTERWDFVNKKTEVVKSRGTYGKNMKFYSYAEAKAWCIEYMKTKRAEAREACFFFVKRFPDSNDAQLCKLFKPKKKIKLKKRIIE